jgi:hypothetical protein
MASFTMTAEDSLRTKLREWHHAHPNGTIEDARRELRPILTKEEVAFLFAYAFRRFEIGE